MKRKSKIACSFDNDLFVIVLIRIIAVQTETDMMNAYPRALILVKIIPYEVAVISALKSADQIDFSTCLVRKYTPIKVTSPEKSAGRRITHSLSPMIVINTLIRNVFSK